MKGIKKKKKKQTNKQKTQNLNQTLNVIDTYYCCIACSASSALSIPHMGVFESFVCFLMIVPNVYPLNCLQWKVRRTLAFSIHELAVILGDQLTAADLVPIFNGFLKDLDEVRIGVLKHLYDFLKVRKC